MSIRARIIVMLLVAAIVPLLITQLYLYGFNPKLLAGSTILFLDLIAVLMALLFAMVVTSHFTLYLGELMIMTKKIQRGEYVTSDTDERKDELGSLARTLNEMSVQLKETHSALETKTANLSELLARDNAILRSISEGLIVTSSKKEIIFVNDAFVKLLGWKPEEALGKRWPDDFGPITTENGKVVPVSKLIISALLETDVPFAEAQYRYPRKSGSPLLVAVSAAQFASAEKERGVVLVFRDITHERAVDRAKSEFVSLASHQLRTPLSTISWFSEVLLDEDKGPLQDEQRRYLEEIYKGNRRMVHLVNSLLDVSRLELGTFVVEPEDVNVAEIAREVVEELSQSSKDKKFQFLQHYEEEMPPCEADPKIIRMIIENLVSNSVKYTPTEGSIAIKVHEHPAGTCNITVKDTGYGIPSNQQDKIFTKLFRADNIRRQDTEGTGLGLYIVRSMVQQLGGSVSFASQENEGTTFQVKIPLRAQKGQEKVGHKESIYLRHG